MANNLTLYLLYTINTLLLITGVHFSLKRKRVYSLLWATLAILQILSVFGSNTFLAKFGLNTLIYGQELMVPANLLFLIVTIGLDIIFLKKKTIAKIDSDRDQYKKRILNRYFFVALAILTFSLMLRFRHGTAVALSNWENARASLGILDSPSMLLGFIYFPSIWVALKEKKYLLFTLMSLFGLILFQIVGSRAMALTLICAIYIDLLRSPIPYLKKLLLLVVLSVAGFGLHTFTRLVRGLGVAAFLALVASGGLFGHLASYDIDPSGGESNIYGFYYYVIDRDYDHYPYRSGVTLIRLALLYIPSSKFPDIKPYDITTQLWIDALQDGYFNFHSKRYIEILQNMLKTNHPGSIHPTLWGDAYANLGLLGIFFYPILFSFISILIEYYITRLSAIGLFVVAPIIGMGYLMIGRGSVITGFGFMGYIIPMIIIIFSLAKIPIRNLQRSKHQSVYATNPISS